MFHDFIITLFGNIRSCKLTLVIKSARLSTFIGFYCQMLYGVFPPPPCINVYPLPLLLKDQACNFCTTGGT